MPTPTVTTDDRAVLAAKRRAGWTLLSMFALLLAGSLGMIVVLVDVAPSVDAFVYAMRSETGVYMLVTACLAGAGAVAAYRARRSGLGSYVVALACAAALLCSDFALAVLVAPPHSNLIASMRRLPFPTPAHAIVLLMVASSLWRAWRASRK
jgi:hypothetical protein